MNRISFFILLFFTLHIHGQNNFEGFIKFSTHISTFNMPDDSYEEELKAKYGDSLVMYYSQNGEFKRIHKNSLDTGLLSQSYNPQKGLIYIKNRNQTVDSLDVKINSLKLIQEKRISNEIIMNLSCECIEYQAISMYDQMVTLNYCFSRLTPKIESNIYSKHNDFFLNKYFDYSKRPYLKFSVRTEDFKLTYIATGIKAEKLKRDLFEENQKIMA